jgi:hypothetical protein
MKHFAAKQDLDVSNLINASFRNRLGSPLKKVTECGQLPNAVADDLATSDVARTAAWSTEDPSGVSYFAQTPNGRRHRHILIDTR